MFTFPTLSTESVSNTIFEMMIQMERIEVKWQQYICVLLDLMLSNLILSRDDDIALVVEESIKG